MRSFPTALFALGLLAGAGLASAAAPVAIGSRNVAIADPAIPRPGTTPCVVELFPRERFGKKGNGANMGATPRRFHYAPPAGCTGPWAKVVLEANFSVAAGYQYDRTASIWLDHVNLYFGTTQEPVPEAAQSWQVQRDLTDYSSLLRHPGTGEVQINNWLDAIRKHAIYADAKLLFYPADSAYPAPRVPDRVYALNGPGNTPATLDGAAARLARSITFPANTTRVYLDLFAQPQAHDEFYYMCLPDRVIHALGTTPPSNGSIDRQHLCGGGSYREAEVSIDGQPAGLAPVVPWVFTGGLDPFLWEPTPAAQTLNFVPYRVDLTPFAGLLSDGKPHRIAIRVLGKPNFFSLAGALLVYQDADVAHTGGAVTRNTLAGAALQPTVSSTLARGADGVSGDVLTDARQKYVIEGYVETPRGRVQSSVTTTLRFGNAQQFSGDSAKGRRHLMRQTASARTLSRSTLAGAVVRSLQRNNRYLLDVHTHIRSGPGAARHRDVQVVQRFRAHTLQRQAGLPFYASDIDNAHVAADRLSYTQGQRTSFTSRDQSSSQNYRFADSLGDCYQAQVQARDGKVTDATHGQGCLNHGPMRWFVRPDGAPDGFGWRDSTHPQRRAGAARP
ncbi:MAG TPA: peptide-N4-asparagine amidase [Rhodanobacteraceae bacterium]